MISRILTAALSVFWVAVALLAIALATPSSEPGPPSTAPTLSGVPQSSTGASWDDPGPDLPANRPPGPRAVPHPLPAGRTVTTERLNPMPATHSGIWSYADPSHGPRYLAIPEGPRWLVTVCGPLDCLDRTSTDAGPDLFLQRKGRIGDLSSADFLAVCGPLSRGLCDGWYVIQGRPVPTPPSTDAK